MTLEAILVPLDGSPFAERALPVARTLAQRVGARVTVMMRTWDDWSSERCNRYLETIAEKHTEIPVDVAVRFEYPVARAIEEVAGDASDGIVCMTSHGRGVFRWAVLGSVAEQVVRESHAPVLLVGRHCRADWPGDFQHIALCIDGTNVDEPIVPVATSWAKTLGLDVKVVLVMHPLDIDGATTANKVVDTIVQRLIDEGVDAKSVVLRGSHISAAIADYAHSLPATLIAMNTHARKGAARVALGSVAMGTVGLAPCPVLVAPWPE